MIILQCKCCQLKIGSQSDCLLRADSFAGAAPNAAVEAEFRFLLGFGFRGGDHFDSGGRAVTAAKTAASAFFDVVFDFAAEAFGANGVLEGIADGGTFSFKDSAKDFGFHCSRSWHVFFTLLGE